LTLVREVVQLNKGVWKMAQKQLRVDDKLYRELEYIAKLKHISVAQAGDIVLRAKMDTLGKLADTKAQAILADGGPKKDPLKREAEFYIGKKEGDGWEYKEYLGFSVNYHDND
jgi:hypothetical protein